MPMPWIFIFFLVIISIISSFCYLSVFHTIMPYSVKNMKVSNQLILW